MRCFAPIINKDTEVLILGSFPGEESLRKREYYGHPRNQFWKILSDIIGDDFVSSNYDTKRKLLLKNRIGLWDVIATCKREGSLDSNIKEEEVNDFSKLKIPNLKAVFFNGKKAASKSDLLKHLNVPIHVLPSTSPANAIRYDKKLKEWKLIKF